MIYIGAALVENSYQKKIFSVAGEKDNRLVDFALLLSGLKEAASRELR